jgi:hypothetical protein
MVIWALIVPLHLPPITIVNAVTSSSDDRRFLDE